MGPTDEQLGLSALDSLPMPSDPKAAMMQRVQAIRLRAAKTMEWKRASGWIACRRCKALYEPSFADQTKKTATSGLCPLCALALRQRIN
jgi:hypothetical protein